MTMKNARESLAHMLQKEIHHGGIHRGQDQRGHLAFRRSHSRVDIDVLSHYLAGDVRSDPWWRPTTVGTADAAKTAFILGHNEDRTLILGWACGDCRLNLGFKVFFNCS